MRSYAASVLLVPLLFACNSPIAAQEPAPAARSEVRAQSPEPHIRFGDPTELAYEEPYFPGASYNSAIPTPDQVLGQAHGSRLAHHAEILECFRMWDEATPLLTLASHGTTHEGRELVHAVITSPANHARLDRIKANLARLHDPRGLSEGAADELLADTPPVAWLGYSIHGDELSGADASLAVAYHLIACEDLEVRELLDQLVIVIDPVLNPDGRERIIGMVEQSAGYTPNLDYASMHRGRWPYGRGNHYLFDMNRDWMAGTQPETRGRWRAALEFHPQLYVDAHEMGSLDTFLFYPQADPINANMPERLVQWQSVYADDAGRAFDEHGWGYYTREWADGWAPFYTDSWSSLTGACGILYEQSSTQGFPLRRASGEVLTYREAVHHQVAASMANLGTLAENRDAVLRDYAANGRRNVAADTPGNDRMVVIPPSDNHMRRDELVRTLTGQGIEVFVSTEAFEITGVVGHRGCTADSLEMPAGSLVIHARQPMAQMVRAYLELDPRMDHDSLVREREELERKGQSKIYDLTSWSLLHALDLEAYWCDDTDAPAERVDGVETLPDVELVRSGDGVPYGWAANGSDDASVAFAARAMEKGLQVHLSDKAFTQAGVPLPSGSLLVRRHENEGSPEEIATRVLAAAREAGLRRVYALTSGRSGDEGPDLGGGHFHLLSRPRVAVLGNAPVAADTYGHLWHYLDTRLGVPFTILDAQAFGGYDLRRYNVLVVPEGSGVGSLVHDHANRLAGWIEGGGTLIACGSSAAAFTEEELGLSQVRRRRTQLENLEPYSIAAEREHAARSVSVDVELVWNVAPAEPESDDEESQDKAPGDEEITAQEDAWLRTFSPYGVTLRGLVDTHHWISAGTGDEMSVFFSGSNALLSKPPVATPVRLAGEEALRLSGLVWPEARGRIARSAWLTVESNGNGQLILFAASPAFRGYHLATGRLFANAVVYGPGVGANQPIGW